MTLRSELEQAAERRADGRCEYCGMHQALQGARFHLEHIVPISRGGETKLDNLAWACPSCNLRKSNRTDAVDPNSAELVSLFNSRLHSWKEHFYWDDYQVFGVSAIGRATISALDLNHNRRIRIRQAEQVFGMFPPDVD
jgi:hypothetical protein